MGESNKIMDRSLYLVLTGEWGNGRTPLSIASLAVEGGIDILQMREKHMTRPELMRLGKDIARYLPWHQSPSFSLAASGCQIWIFLSAKVRRRWPSFGTLWRLKMWRKGSGGTSVNLQQLHGRFNHQHGIKEKDSFRNVPLIQIVFRMNLSKSKRGLALGDWSG
ncbi:MAG: hypothetical protein CSYNP_01717 [Syntrophus sp. SKADARSKE-3]|nr:hypothetical protein [Syntrophus sp. SKADARSKE-3]